MTSCQASGGTSCEEAMQGGDVGGICRVDQADQGLNARYEREGVGRGFRSSAVGRVDRDVGVEQGDEEDDKINKAWDLLRCCNRSRTALLRHREMLALQYREEGSR